MTNVIQLRSPEGLTRAECNALISSSNRRSAHQVPVAEAAALGLATSACG